MHRLREAGGARLSLTATVMHFFYSVSKAALSHAAAGLLSSNRLSRRSHITLQQLFHNL